MSTFITIKTIVAAAFLFQLQILLKMGTLVRIKNLFMTISLVKLNHSHRKYSRKKLYRRIFLKCQCTYIFQLLTRRLYGSQQMMEFL